MLMIMTYLMEFARSPNSFFCQRDMQPLGLTTLTTQRTVIL